jgi:2-methylthioadenine synthetase
VPYTRGEELSRPFDDVLVEVAKLAAQGVREVNLLGQNVNAYRGPTHDGGIADLAVLIHAIAQIDGIGRIRFTTSHPLEFSDSLIEAYANVPQLANYLHLPVQAGSDPHPQRDEARLHRDWSSSRRSASCARCGRTSACRPISSWASPARPPRISRRP